LAAAVPPPTFVAAAVFVLEPLPPARATYSQLSLSAVVVVVRWQQLKYVVVAP
jgi:hypothetical protein